MFLRIDKLQVELPRPESADPDAAAVQELMGGKFGEMSTLMNYTYQSFNMRGKSKIRPYYDLVANIAAEEMGHIELVANTVNLLLDKTVENADGSLGAAPLGMGLGAGYPDHFLNTGLGTMAAGAGARSGAAITSSLQGTSSWISCTTSSWSPGRGWVRSGYTRRPITRWRGR